MFVQTVRIPVLEFFIAPIPGGGLGFLHPWKSEIATFRHRTLERGPETVQHPAGLVLSEDISSTSLSKPILRTRSAKCAAIVEIRRKSPRKSYSIHKKKPSLIVDALNNTAPGGSSVNARIAGLDLLNAFSGSFAERGSRRLDIIDIYVIILCYRLRCDLPRSRDSIFRVSYFVYRRLSSPFVEYVFWDCSRGFE